MTGFRTPHEDSLYRAARRTATIAAAYCVFVLVLLVANTIASRYADPLQPAKLTELHLRLNREPTNETLRRQTRRLDADIRRAYLRSRNFAVTGFYLLLGGVAVLLLSMEVARRRNALVPVPRPSAPEDYWLAAAESRRSVIGLSAVMGGTLLTLAVLSRHDVAAEYARAAQRPVALPVRLAAPTAAPLALSGPLPPAPTPGAATVPTPALPVGGSLAAPSTGTTLVPESAPAPVVPAVVQPVSPTGQAPGPTARSTGWAQAAPWTTKAAADQWPGFRGPAGVGLASRGPWPTAWDGASGRGVLWKVAVPLPGWNSPVVWGDRVLLYGADATRREVYCFAAASGKPLWKRPLPVPAGWAQIKVAEETGHAPATMVTEGTRACISFVNGDVACLDLAGRVLWTRQLGAPDNHYGHASCPLIYGGGLILQMDQGTAAEDGKSSLLALDLKTGQTVWQVKRPVPNAWSSPVVVRAGTRDELITCANPWVIAYDPRSGTELWRAECLGGEVAPSPAVDSGFVFATNQTSNLAALRVGGSGNVTKTGIAWQFQENLPDITSPVAVGGFAYLLTTEGLLTCVDARTGKKVWEHAYDLTFRSSPIVAGGRLYALDNKGTMHIVELGKSFREVARASLPEEVNATPGFAAGRIFVRTKEHLYCIGGK